MPTFLTELLVHGPGANELSLLQDELAQQSFVPIASVRRYNQGPEPIHFKRYAESICDVSQAVLKAVNKTGKKYSFTIIKEK